MDGAATELLAVPWERLTLTTALVIALVGGWRSWWVFGWLYLQVKGERDAALAKLDAQDKTLERLVSLLEAREALERERR